MYTQRDSQYTHCDSWYTLGNRITSNAIQHLRTIFLLFIRLRIASHRRACDALTLVSNKYF